MKQSDGFVSKLEKGPIVTARPNKSYYTKPRPLSGAQNSLKSFDNDPIREKSSQMKENLQINSGMKQGTFDIAQTRSMEEGISSGSHTGDCDDFDGWEIISSSMSRSLGSMKISRVVGHFNKSFPF